MAHHSTEQGYIALFTVLILTGVLMIVVLATSTGGFQSNSVMQNALAKEESYQAAHGCLALARAQLFQNRDYGGAEDKDILGVECRIEPLSENIIETRAEVQGAFTRLRATINETTLAIESIEELTS